jgi:glycosyltransferase involved in cell wall biosynthesis
MRKTKARALLVYWDSKFGIARDIEVMEDSLARVGIRWKPVATRMRHDKRERILKFFSQCWRMFFPADFQIHLEQVHREQFRFSRRNYMILNPEFTDPDVFAKLRHDPVILCKTRHALEVFNGRIPKVEYMGFTSPDRLQPATRKSFRKFLHVAGKSDYKGTRELVEVWSRNPNWPELTVVWSPTDSYGNPRKNLEAGPNVRVIFRRLGDEELIDLLNESGVHLCPSRTEGFGHYMVEALSTGAIVVTLDAPPMNELVSTGYGYLVEAFPLETQFMSTLYKPDLDSLEDTISQIVDESPATLQEKSKRAREWYLRNDERFHQRFSEIMKDYTR